MTRDKLTDDIYSDSAQLFESIQPALLAAVERHGLPARYLDECRDLVMPIAARMAASVVNRSHSAAGALIWGVCGSQGSGKSTLVDFLGIILEQAYGLDCLTLSIDDFYLSRQQRRKLAEDVHPLLMTRGVPGTHDAVHGIELFTQLGSAHAGDRLELPAFDKASDDTEPSRVLTGDDLPTGGFDIVLFEGWCVGTPPEPEERLATAVNQLEAQDDSDGRWRRSVNDQLAGVYKEWFGLLKHLLLIRAPGFEQVHEWRLEQEDKLRARFVDRGETVPAALMSEQQIARFIAHYERLTRWNLEVLPQRAEIVLELNSDHSMRALTGKSI